MKAAEVPGFLAELSSLGVGVVPDGVGGLRVTVPRSVTSPADIVRRVRSAKPAVLAYFQGQESRNAEAEAVPEQLHSFPRRTGAEEWEGAPEVYGADALPRRHAPPSEQVPEDRPHVQAVRVCGGCARWSADFPGAEGGSCSAGWAVHNLPPCLEVGPLPVTSRGSRCWAWGGKGWRKGVKA